MARGRTLARDFFFSGLSWPLLLWVHADPVQVSAALYPTPALRVLECHPEPGPLLRHGVYLYVPARPRVWPGHCQSVGESARVGLTSCVPSQVRRSFTVVFVQHQALPLIPAGNSCFASALPSRWTSKKCPSSSCFKFFDSELEVPASLTARSVICSGVTSARCDPDLQTQK